ncbi:ABC-three component system middle component 1 [Paenibacillus azoreducens]|uniref:ABC-three component system middle component 1 n=1 Tax=Paenibacillus azoreducens TaxID=116718 RepID=UPI0039F50695
MKAFMKMTLLENGFSIDESCFNEDAFQADRLDGNGFDFLTVGFMNQDQISEESLTEKIQQFHSVLSEKKGAIIGMNKNLSLLIMLKVNSLDYPPFIQSLIFDFEEDPYIFKKYILTYTAEQENMLTSMFKESGEKAVTPFLYEILYDTEKFSAFKNREANDSTLLYDLVSKIFIKLPYLSIKNQHKDMDVLLDDILESFDEGDRGTWDTMMRLREHNGSDPSIEEILKTLGVDVGE